MGLMAVVGHGSLQRDNPHHESNSILLGPHVPRSHQDIESSEGVPFEVGEGVETRREDSLIRDIYKPRTSEDRLIQIAEYPNSSQRSPFAPFLHERQPKSISVSFIYRPHNNNSSYFVQSPTNFLDFSIPFLHPLPHRSLLHSFEIFLHKQAFDQGPRKLSSSTNFHATFRRTLQYRVLTDPRLV